MQERGKIELMNQKGLASILVIGIIVAVIAIGAGDYFYVSKQNEESPTENSAINEPTNTAPVLENKDIPEATTTQKQESKKETTPLSPGPILTPTITKEPAITVHQSVCSRIFSPKYSVGPHYTGPLFDAHLHMPTLIDISKVDPNKLEGHGADIAGHIVVDRDAELDKLLCNFEREKVRGAIGFTIGEAELLAETLSGAKSMKAKVGSRVDLFLTPASFNAGILNNIIAGNKNLFAGFGEMAFYHPSYIGTPPDAPSVMQIYEVARKHNIMVMMHPNARQESAIENAVKQNPNIKFLLHGPETENTIHGIIGKYPNVYYSIDTILIRLPSVPGPLMYMVGGKDEFKAKFAQNYTAMLSNSVNQWKAKIEQYPDRYMWGTDRSDPWTYDEDMSALIEEFARDFIAELDPAVQENFAYKNAEKLFGR